MTVSFDGVNKGDRVRLSREGGDVTIFTVAEKPVRQSFLRSKSNGYRDIEWDQVDVLERALPTTPGLYVIERLPQYVFRRFEYNAWVIAVMQGGIQAKSYGEKDLRELVNAHGPLTLIKEHSE